MANRQARAGTHSAGPQRGPEAVPPPVHHRGFPRSPRTAPASPAALAWLPYLIVLAGVAVGMFVIWQGSQYAGLGAGLVGGTLLAAAVTRLVLPPRSAGLLASRGRALDVATYAVLGAAVLGVALSLP
jgi:Protein of unknown function (DUF3017)